MKYIVNVHLGTTIQVEVNANDEDEAELLGASKVQSMLASNSLANNALRSIQVIDAEVTSSYLHKLKDLKDLDPKLIIKKEK